MPGVEWMPWNLWFCVESFALALPLCHPHPHPHPQSKSLNDLSCGRTIRPSPEASSHHSHSHRRHQSQMITTVSSFKSPPVGSAESYWPQWAFFMPLALESDLRHFHRRCSDDLQRNGIRHLLVVTCLQAGHALQMHRSFCFLSSNTNTSDTCLVQPSTFSALSPRYNKCIRMQ